LGPSHSSAWCESRGKPRQRVCLLKGCERPYRPSHPLDRYCSDDCREAARRWTRHRANRRYRHSEQGKQRRREQSRRYRQQRCQDRSADEGSAPVTKAGGEGYQGRRAQSRSAVGVNHRFGRQGRAVVVWCDLAGVLITEAPPATCLARQHPTADEFGIVGRRWSPDAGILTFGCQRRLCRLGGSRA
jgi:hypothetical protein